MGACQKDNNNSKSSLQIMLTRPASIPSFLSKYHKNGTAKKRKGKERKSWIILQNEVSFLLLFCKVAKNRLQSTRSQLADSSFRSYRITMSVHLKLFCLLIIRSETSLNFSSTVKYPPLAGLAPKILRKTCLFRNLKLARFLLLSLAFFNPADPGSHREIYRDFQPSLTSSAGGAKG